MGIYQNHLGRVMVHNGRTQSEGTCDTTEVNRMLHEFGIWLLVAFAFNIECRGDENSKMRAGTFGGDKIELLVEHSGMLDGNMSVKFSWCPSGTFVMGSPESELLRDSDESQVSVTLTRGFWISQTEVTQRLWTNIMTSTPWHCINGVPNIPDLPATNVSYADARRFCKALTRKARTRNLIPENWFFSLPTEAQWEYACRAGSTSAYYFGDSSDKLPDFAWCYLNRLPDNPQLMARPVGSRLPNSWGIYDMLGNVDEWCVDVWNDEMLVGGKDPVSKPKRDISGDLFIQRGGNFDCGARKCRSASRSFGAPETGSEFSGFRVVLSEKK
jgi:formylglycine-generating enzyme